MDEGLKMLKIGPITFLLFSQQNAADMKCEQKRLHIPLDSGQIKGFGLFN